jgi:diguanylate cyclase (GGDEF)-like protein/PAS domain S-box-containing protein
MHETGLERPGQPEEEPARRAVGFAAPALQLAVIAEVGARIAGAGTVEGVLETACKEARWLLTVHRCTLGLLEAGGDSYTLFELDPGSGSARRLPARSVREGLAGRVMRAGEPLIVSDFAGEERPGPEDREALGDEIRSALILPLVIEGRLLGVLNLAATRPAAYANDSLAIGRLLALQVASAVRNALLVRDLDSVNVDLERRVRERTQELRAAEGKYRALVEQMPAVTYIESAATGAWTYVSPRIRDLLGLVGGEDTAELSAWAAALHPEDRERVLEARASARLRREGFALEYRLLAPDARLLWVRDEAVPVEGERHWQGVILDISERKRLEAQLARQAFLDRLTGLPNRALFMDRLEHALARSARRRGAVAVLYVDLDRFKSVNDSLGHDAGDALLLAAGQRLRGCLRPEDTAARIGGDEFTVLLESIARPADAIRVAERIGTALAEPFEASGHRIAVTASIGIALAGTSGEASAELLRAADIAMYRAKRTGKSRWEMFDPAMGQAALERVRLEADLRLAMERDELRVHYQPKVDLRTGRIAELEALVRWERPGEGLTMPAQFIGVAEETGLIVPLGRWVIRSACTRMRQLQELYPGARGYKVDINLSAGQFQDPKLVGDIASVLADTGLEPDRLEVEITESVLMDDAEATIHTLRELKGLGVGLAIDDFGTGYSSLSYLQRFPVDTLKIDRTFIRRLDSDEGTTAIVRAVVGLGKALGLKLVAEGVETEEQAAQLRALGCDLAQGYYISHPLPAEELAAVVARDAPLLPRGGHRA